MRTGNADQHALPARCDVKAPGSAETGSVPLPGASRFLAPGSRLSIRHSRPAAAGNLLSGVAVFESEKARPKAEAKSLDAYPAKLGHR